MHAASSTPVRAVSTQGARLAPHSRACIHRPLLQDQPPTPALLLLAPPTLRALIPKKTSSATPATSPRGKLLWRLSGTLLNAAPMPTLIRVITASALRLPTKLIQRPSFIASSAAMKKVLSPSSDRKMRQKDASRPERPRGPSMRYACSAVACPETYSALHAATAAPKPRPHRTGPAPLCVQTAAAVTAVMCGWRAAGRSSIGVARASWLPCAYACWRARGASAADLPVNTTTYLRLLW
jgi:hypothetical protein